jgi:hypothetical protein
MVLMFLNMGLYPVASLNVMVLPDIRAGTYQNLVSMTGC